MNDDDNDNDDNDNDDYNETSFADPEMRQRLYIVYQHNRTELYLIWGRKCANHRRLTILLCICMSKSEPNFGHVDPCETNGRDGETFECHFQLHCVSKKNIPDVFSYNSRKH